MKKKDIVALIIVAIVFLILLYILFFGKRIAVSSITLNKNDISLLIGDTVKLEYNITPDDATDKKILWESSDENVATVDENGLIIATGEGTSLITVKSKNSQIFDRCVVNVFKNNINKFEFSESFLDLRIDEPKNVNVIIDQVELKDMISYSSSDETIVKVDSTGKVTGLKNGKAIITANIGDTKATCEVNVVIPVETIEMGIEVVNVELGKEEILNISITPEIAANQEIHWLSSDDSIASVNNGKVTAKQVGEVIITAAIDDKEATCRVIVVIPVTDIKLNKKSLSMNKGDSEILTATISPPDATNKEITWTSSNEKVAKVDNGKVTAMGTGKATITATVDGKKATCEVTSIGYVITNNQYSNYSVVASYDSETLKYRIMKKVGNYVSIWVMDAYKQWNSALPKINSSYAAEDLLGKEISQYSYQNKGLVATNASFFWDGWGESPCIPFILNKGNIIRDIQNIDYNKRVYSTFGMTKDIMFKSYNFTANNYAKNQEVKQEMLKDGVRNNFSHGITVIDYNGNVTTDKDVNNRTILCQVDENNYVIYSGGSLSFAQIGKELKNTFKCRVAINLDGGGSRKLYYKTNTASINKVFGGSRHVPDMMYFVEQ